jgi:ELWxxDGT repeat protein
MNFLPFRCAFRVGSKNSQRVRRHARRREAVFGRLGVECLEDRCLPSVLGPLVDNQGHVLANVQDLTNVNRELYFSANDGIHGQKLFKSDGTQAGTEMVAATISDSSDSIPSDLINVNGTLFFTANNPLHSVVFESNGTAAGTFLAADPGVGCSQLMNVDGTVFFLGTDGSLYEGDGQEVSANATGPVDNDPSAFAVVANRLYFVAPYIVGIAFWSTNDTPARSSIVFDNRGDPFARVSDFVNVGNTLYFAAVDGVHGSQLWGLSLNGDFALPTMLTDINPTGGGLNPTDLTNVNGTLFFNGDDGVNGQQLWKSDGTAGGTVPVTNFLGGIFPEDLTNVNGTLFFRAFDTNNVVQLWKSDGTTAGTVPITNAAHGISPSNLTNVNGTLFFNAQDPNDGSLQLWASDGTTAGTVELTDVNVAAGGLNPINLTDVNGTLYFTDSANGGLWEVPNSPPVANDVPYNAVESTPLTIPAEFGLLANAAPAAYGSPYALAVVTPPSDGTLTLKPDGSFSYTPNAGFVGTDTFTYRATDGDLSSSPGTVTVIVAAGQIVNQSPASLSATEFQPVSGVVASFVDTGGNDGAADYTALINWGDGAITQGTVAPFGAALNVLGTHTYTHASTYTTEVTLFDADGSGAFASGSADVLDAALQGHGRSTNFVEGVAGSGVVATFSDADPTGQAGDYTATINWGDGSTSSGTVQANGSSFVVNGTHTYP